MSNKKDKGLVEFSEVQLREIFTKAGLNSQDIDKAIADYMRYREGELSSLSILSYKDLQSLGAEALYENIKEVSSGEYIFEDVLIRYLRYIYYKKEIAETYQESKSWDKVITTAVSDRELDKESFIDYVEETYQTKIKDAKHLQKLTGITEETLEGLEEALIYSKDSKYFRALEKALKEGAKYKDLLKIKPQSYGLPETDKNGKSYQYSTILSVISFEYLLVEFYDIRPNLRTVAQDLEAPYSLVLDAWKLTAY